MICVVGSSNTDLVVTSQKLPAPGETVLGGEFRRFPGGKGANQAVAAARAGGKVAFVAALGADAFGRDSFTNFEREAIDVSHIRLHPGVASGIALILVDAAGENLISVASGANMLVSPAEIGKAEAVIAQADYLLLQLEIPLESVERAAQLARRNGTRVILNPAPCPAGGLTESILSSVDILIPNEIECCQLGGTEDLDGAIRALLGRGIQTVIVTRGARGVLVCDKDGIAELAAPKVAPVDTVGAGDCFCATLAVALDEGLALTDAVRFAMCAAAVSVTRAGAQSSFPTRVEIDAFS